MDLSTGGDLDACREAIIEQQHRADRHRADLLDDHRPARSRTSTTSIDPRDARAPGASRASTTSRSTPACCASTCRSCSKRLIGIVSPRRLAARQVDDRPRQAEPDVHALGRDLRHHARVRRHVLASATACAPAASPTRPTQRSSPSCDTLGELTERAWRQGRAGDGRRARATCRSTRSNTT